MHDPYRMVFISLIAGIIALISIYSYFKFFKKKKINYLLLLLLVSLPALVSILRPGSYESGDLSLHTMRLTSFYNILVNEQTLPRWTPEFNVGFGDPHFLFAYFLPYFLTSIFHFIGFSFLDSVKLLLALSFILSGFAMYLWAKDELGEKAGFVSALFYLFAPYHLVDLHFRVTIAETLSFVFLPILLLLAKKIITKPSINLILMSGLCYGLLLLTHQIISLLFSPILVAYTLFLWFSKKKRTYKQLLIYFSSLLLGFLLTAFYWFPILSEAQYTQASLAKNISSFTPLHELLYSPWRLGFLFQGHMGELSFLIGYTQLFIVATAIYFLFKKRFENKTKHLLLFFLILLSFLIFMITPYSKEIWAALPFFKYSQYSYRLSEFVVLCTSIIAGIVVTKWKRNSFIIILCLITVFYTILNWGNRKALSYVQDTYLINEFKARPDVPTHLEPSSPIWTDKKTARTKPKGHIEILSGNAQIVERSRSSTVHTYLINAESEVRIKENTLYFPGWTLLVNDREKHIYYTDPKYPGIMTFSLPKGLHEVTLVFRDTQNRHVASTVSIVSGIATILIFLSSFLRNNPNISSTKRKRKIK